MRVPDHIVSKRRQELAKLIRQNRYVPVQDICDHFNISEATARRDLRALEGGSEIFRTFGGVVGDFNEGFESFNDRRKFAETAKAAIARKAVAHIEPGMVCFLDAGSTLYAVAEELSSSGKKDIQVMTNNLAVAELLTPVDGISVILTGGKLATRQEVLLGEVAERTLERCTFDIAFMSAQAANEDGIWNNQEDIVCLQRLVVEHTAKAVFCLDRSKINGTMKTHVVGWDKVNALLTDATKAYLIENNIDLIPSKHWMVRK
jgi:DeoR/GlpR family transcriptional regulator of sugar metabolism